MALIPYFRKCLFHIKIFFRTPFKKYFALSRKIIIRIVEKQKKAEP